MGEKKKSNANTTALIGAAFLMATSAIGPGFLTQTATFTGQYGSIFASVHVRLLSLRMPEPFSSFSLQGKYCGSNLDSLHSQIPSAPPAKAPLHTPKPR